MAITPEEVRQRIAELVDKYKRETNRSQSEADVRSGYIDLLFLALGWNVYNNPGEVTHYRREGYIRGAGIADVGLEIAGQPTLMLEAKKLGALPRFNERLGDRTTEEKQAFRYARTRKLPYVILTNFERLQVFNADHERLILWFDDPKEYLLRLPELLHLSPERVQAGSLPATERQLEIKPIDEEFLALLQDWRLRLANAIYEHNPNNTALKTDESFDFSKLMAAVQRILDRLILIRYADDKEVLLVYDVIETILGSYRKKGAYTRPDHLMRELIDLSHTMDDHHNTTLFQPGHICEQVFIPNEVLENIMGEINNISFRKFTSDILGNTYETYLGTKLVLKNGGIKSEERRDIRKAGGIYYTPPSIVHYIVDNTLGHLLKELEREHELHAIERAQAVKVLDPACGSGSFLIYAYQVLANFYRRMNKAIENEQMKLVASGAGADMFERLELFKQLPKPLDNYPHHILENQLYGVDIDPEAAEIAAVNLTMQAFADSRKEKLPLILNENIKVGNSLISGTEGELRPYFGDKWREKKPFSWEQEFAQIMQGGGFDVVISNPPWIESKRMESTDKAYYQQAFLSMYGQYDIFNGFVERGLQLLRENGVLGFIMPNRFIMNPDYADFRQVLLNTIKIIELCDVGEHIFEGVEMPAAIALLEKESNLEQRNRNQVRVKTNIKNLEGAEWREYSVPQERFVKEHAFIFTIYQPIEVDTIIQKMESNAVKLGQLVDNARGVEIGKRSPLVCDRALGDDYVPFLAGEDIDRYIIFGRRFLRLGDPKVDYKSPQLYQGEKILVRKTGTGIRATLDDANFYVIQVIYIFKPKSQDFDLRYLLGLINSKLMSSYHFTKFGEKRKQAFPHLRQELVLQFPIRRINFANPAEKKIHDDLVALVDRMLELNKRLAPIRNTPCSERDDLQREIERTDSEIDNLVYDLYGLTEEERRIVEEKE